MKSPSTPEWVLDAQRHLASSDPVMARIIESVGPVQIKRRPERFQALVRAIIFQQLAGRAAQAIFQRFVGAVGAGRFPSPAQVITASDEVLRGAGLSRGKIASIRDLAAHVRDGSLNFHRFPRMDDEAIIIELTRVRGIGRWTAEMFLMFNLCRPDVLAVGDLGLRNAATKAYGAKAALGPSELQELGEAWRPYRTAAAWYLWRSMVIVTPDGSTDDGAAPPPLKGRAKTAQLKDTAKTKPQPRGKKAKPKHPAKAAKLKRSVKSPNVARAAKPSRRMPRTPVA